MSLWDTRNKTTSPFSFLMGTMSRRHQNCVPVERTNIHSQCIIPTKCSFEFDSIPAKWHHSQLFFSLIPLTILVIWWFTNSMQNIQTVLKNILYSLWSSYFQLETWDLGLVNNPCFIFGTLTWRNCLKKQMYFPADSSCIEVYMFSWNVCVCVNASLRLTLLQLVNHYDTRHRNRTTNTKIWSIEMRWDAQAITVTIKWYSTVKCKEKNQITTWEALKL